MDPPQIDHSRLALGGRPVILLAAADGDTLRIQGNPLITAEDRVRLLGIDAPERNENGWSTAREKLLDLCRGRELRLEPASPPTLTRGRCNRILAWVWAGEDLVNWGMVVRGLARSAHDWGEGTHTAALDQAEAHARTHGLRLNTLRDFRAKDRA